MVADPSWWQYLALFGSTIVGSGGSHAVLVKGKTQVNVEDVVQKVLDGLRAPITKQVEGVLAGADETAQKVTAEAEKLTGQTPAPAPATETTVMESSGTGSQTTTVSQTETSSVAAGDTQGIVGLLNTLSLQGTGDQVSKVVDWLRSKGL